ncbi:hypothetical protein G647_01728 [Cladophialophora carrionii CBS 160.54]|uniref:Secreted protein n=1 Tax=Cladophialophora carrionii CBS 160.54 TaxID=1279043 RepID=V9DQV8_9EURO|nr:uncharacterized protein G647_01728 [Cladophialophora carrionii CBS 160.54]ETI29275.1 hypothetical protein G647_01728 [Cladophialophora carrionii CBS 160.54]
MFMKVVLVLVAAFLPLQESTALPFNGTHPAFLNSTHPAILNGTWPGIFNGTRPAALNERDDYNLQDVVIGCNDDKCAIKTVLVDANAPKYSHTCPRMALAAKANYLEFCEEKRDGMCLTPINTPKWPEITVCCGDWVYVEDPYYKDYPTMRDPETGEEVPLKTGADLYVWPSPNDYLKNDQVWEDHPDWMFREVIKPNAWEFKVELPVCGLWVPQSEPQFQYFMQNLRSTYHIDEVKETEDSNMDAVGPPDDP